MPYADNEKNKECKRKCRQRNKEYKRDIKLQMFKEHGCGGTLTEPCRWQGDVPPVALHFDHIKEKGVKKNNISRMSNHAIETVKKEIDKCELVCANCHSIRTEQRRLIEEQENENKKIN